MSCKWRTKRRKGHEETHFSSSFDNCGSNTLGVSDNTRRAVLPAAGSGRGRRSRDFRGGSADRDRGHLPDNPGKRRVLLGRGVLSLRQSLQ